jgi:hypothetical protein
MMRGVTQDAKAPIQLRRLPVTPERVSIPNEQIQRCRQLRACDPALQLK